MRAVDPRSGSPATQVQSAPGKGLAPGEQGQEVIARHLAENSGAPWPRGATLAQHYFTKATGQHRFPLNGWWRVDGAQADAGQRQTALKSPAALRPAAFRIFLGCGASPIDWRQGSAATRKRSALNRDRLAWDSAEASRMLGWNAWLARM